MSEQSPSRSQRKISKRREQRTLLKFVEELSWLLSSYDDLDFRALGNLSAEIDRTQRATSNIASHSSQRLPTAQLLVGTLPSLLRDETLFSANEDIVEFAMMALDISIPRWQKKSRYELIGHIVCNTDLANDDKLNTLVKILDEMVTDKGEVRK
ncbi:MAG: hypothetical protein ABF459_14285, partial [Gluconobacter cerinus]|uniref:hypothetical protein n=1 Tax=Gluconobacter cerinus TaxID=38307 RepID=UPI0039EA160D